MSIICGIDVGSENSGICFWDTKRQKIVSSNDKQPNDILTAHSANYIVIEDVVSYGMPVGKSTFDTCKAIGMFKERFDQIHDGKPVYLVTKPEIQLHFCNTSRAKDANIKRVLLDRFGEKGTKKNQGTLYPLKNHSWDAFALCIYLEDNILKGD